MLQENNKNSFKKRQAILIGMALASLIIAITVISIIHISKAKEVEFISYKDNFRADENLVFKFKYRGDGESQNLNIKVIIFDYRGEEVAQLNPDGHYENGEISVDLTKYFKEIKPGKYRIKFEIEDKNKGKIYVENKEFTWGVLAINVNKSIYLSGEEAYIQMAVLRDNGHTICDANLRLQIQNPKSKIQNLSTENGTIKYSGKCGPDNVTNVPDYFAYYQVKEPGTYQMKLTNLDNGYEITDSFEVKDFVPFEVERIGPTRIWPRADYEMTFRIKVNQDFKGELIESVPESFKILNAKPYTLNPGQIIWQVDWRAGNTYELKYIFDAPDISPYLYLLGPLEISGGGTKFQEARQWQIAADSPDIAVDAVSTGTGSGSSITVSHTTGSGTNRLMLVGISAKSPAGMVISSIAYGGVALTLVGGTSNWLELRIYRLVAPATGTANLVVNFSTAPSYGCTVGVMTFTGVDQTTPLGTFIQANGYSTTASVNVSSATGELVFDTLVTTYIPTVGAGQTEQWKASGYGGHYGSGSTEPGAATVTMSWTFAIENWRIGAVPIKPLSNTAPDTPTISYPADGATGIGLGTNLAFNYSDTDSDTCTKFDIMVDDDSLFGSPVINVTDYATGGPWSSGTVIHYPDAAGLSYNTKYYWKVRVYDGTAWSGWSDGTWDFTTKAEPEPPGPDKTRIKGSTRIKGGVRLR